MSEYQRTMAEFLRVQESVMLAYLGQSAPARPAMPAPTLAAAPAPVVAPTPVVATPAVVPPQSPEPAPKPVAEAPAATATLDEDGMIAIFLEVIAEKTGYPSNALDADQAMEADLGVDSIKRMEILGAVQKVIPDALAQSMRGEMSKITQLPSVREIVEHVFAHDVSHESPTVEGSNPFDQAGEAEISAHAVLPRFVQRPFAESMDHVPDDLPERMEIVVIEAEDGFHENLLEGLKARGLTAYLMPADVLATGDLEAWFSERLSEGAPLGLIWSGARAAMPEAALEDFAAWQEVHETGTKRFFQLLQAAAPRLKPGGRVVAVMQAGGRLGFGLEERDGLSSAPGATGLIKALSLEWPEVSLKLIDLDPADGAGTQTGYVLRELSFRSGRREVGYYGGERFILRTEPASIAPPEEAPLRPGPDWVILATGGARGVTAECLRTLAPYKPTLVLAGRSPAPDPLPEAMDAMDLRAHFLAEAKAAGEKIKPAEVERKITKLLARRDMTRNLRDFKAMGAQVEYRVADVGDPEAARGLVAGVLKDHGRIDMLVHGAGIIEDAQFEKKTRESFDRVFDTKVNGAFLITQAAHNPHLKGVCFFSSVAGRYGNPGQADYAAANETLNRYAWALKRGPLADVTVKTVNWGPWGQTTTGAGMVTPTVRQQFLERGIGMVEAEPGRCYFFQEMFWAPEGEVETSGWVADGETLEAAACALPQNTVETPVDPAKTVLLRSATQGQDTLHWRFDIISAPYTDDHRFDGQAVMPMAGAVQILSELPGAFGLLGEVASVENLKMFKGLTLEDGPLGLRLECQKRGADLIRGRILSEAGGQTRVHYEADLRLLSALPQSQTQPQWRSSLAWTGPNMAHIYRDWLSHGPRLQTLDRLISLDAQHVRLEGHRTRPSDFVPVGPEARWQFDPGLLDGMVQTLWVWSRALHDMSALPLSVEAVRRFPGSEVPGSVLVETGIREMSETGEILSVIRAFAPDTGTLLYEIDGFRCQATGALNRLGGGWPGGARPWFARQLDAAE